MKHAERREAIEQAFDEDVPLPPLFPSNEILRKVFSIESDEALKLCRRAGVPVPREK